MLKKLSSSLILLSLLATGGLQTAKGQSGLSKDSKGRATAIKSKLPSDIQDPTGQLLTRALADLEHCQNLGKLKDEQIASLKDLVVALREEVRVDEERIAELKKANEARQEADKIGEERFKLQEQRIALYKSVVDDFEKEVNRLRAKLLRAQMWGNIKATVALFLGAWIGYTLGSK